MSAGLRERLLKLAAKARRVSNDQCSGKNWAMSIPPQPDDSDMVIHALADAAETAAAALDGQGDAAPRVAPSQWQPIETMSNEMKDGRFVVLFGSLPSDEGRFPGDMPGRACLSRWSERVQDTPAYIKQGWVFMAPGYCDRFLPTHWLPAPPVTSGSGDEARDKQKQEKNAGLPR